MLLWGAVRSLAAASRMSQTPMLLVRSVLLAAPSLCCSLHRTAAAPFAAVTSRKKLIKAGLVFLHCYSNGWSSRPHAVGRMHTRAHARTHRHGDTPARSQPALCPSAHAGACRASKAAARGLGVGQGRAAWGHDRQDPKQGMQGSAVVSKDTEIHMPISFPLTGRPNFTTAGSVSEWVKEGLLMPKPPRAAPVPSLCHFLSIGRQFLFPEWGSSNPPFPGVVCLPAHENTNFARKERKKNSHRKTDSPTKTRRFLSRTEECAAAGRLLALPTR